VPVLAIRTEVKCKFCAHPARDQIDLVLERRAQGEPAPDGEPFTLRKLYPILEKLGVENPTKENVHNHWTKHCRRITQAEYDQATVDTGLEAAETDERVRALVSEILGEEYFDNPKPITPDQSLELIRALGTYELVERARKGQNIGVTVDQLLKSIDGATRRKSSDAANELLRGLGQAIGASASRALAPPPPAIDAGVVEHEPVKEEVVDED
jgi:hypothetical protein